MENVWVVLKANITNYKLRLIKYLIRIIKKEYKKLNKLFTENLVFSIRNRISLILFNKDNYILY